MSRLKVWQKLALMGVIFMAPFAVVAYKMTSSINALGVESARMEVQGLAFYAPARALVKDLQLHRDIAGAWLAGDASFKDRLAAKRADVDDDIKALDAIDLRLGGMLHTTDQWSAIRAACKDILAKTPSMSPDQSFASHSRVINSAIAMIAHVGHASNLTLDPDVGRKLLVDVLILEGPELSEALARARGLGTVAANGKRTSEQIESLNRDAVLVEFVGAKVEQGLVQALKVNEAFRSQLDTEVQATSAAVLDAMARIVMLTRSDGAETTPQEYFTAVTRGVDAIGELEARIMASLQASLDARIAALRRDVVATFGWAACGLLIVCVVGIVIIRDVTVTLGQVVNLANQIAIGDLSSSIASGTRKDEIGVLAHAFNRMVAALKDTVQMAERIAAGDLAVTVTPRSDNDVMGKALEHMVGRLSALVGEVQQSGVHVNASVNQIAATTKQQQATTTAIAATTTEIRATSEQIASTSNDLLKTMKDVSALAAESASLAESGQNGVVRMEATMREVIDAAGAINTRLQELSEKASGITNVVTTIMKVADQTNLLSLNAAIEAQKAGEYGRGFTVVATEIRRLADQTAVATIDIDQMVKEIQSAVTAGVMGMDMFSKEVGRGMDEIQQVGNQLSQIIRQVQALAPKFEAVHEGMYVQAVGSEQITLALSQLAEAVEQTVESLRESNDIIDGLNHAASGMRSGVSRFKVAA